MAQTSRSSILQGVGVGVGNPVQQQQQQGTWTASPLTQRKVTMAGQQAPVVAAPAGRGVTPQQNRVCEKPLHAFPCATLTIYLY